MRAYFEDSNAQSDAARSTMFFLFGVTALSILTAALIFLGWVALGERADISRRNLNAIEWTTIAFGVLFLGAALRTYFYMQKRNRAGWAWSQWTAFATMIAGIILMSSALIPQTIGLISNLRAPIPSEAFFVWQIDAGRVLFINGALVVGLALFLAGLYVYNVVIQDWAADDTKVEKAQGAFSTDISDMIPTALIRTQLAKSPGAGAIIGFVAIFFIFSFASEQFLTSLSIASFLTNISTKGIVAIGVTILMIGGEFDLSVGSLLGAVSLFFMLFMTDIVPEAIRQNPDNVLMITTLAALGAIAVALFLGFINGYILVKTGIPSFIVTLGTLLIYRAIPLVAIPGGRILRYRDFYPQDPVIQINPIFGALLGVVLLVLLGFFAYRALPGMIAASRSRWENRNIKDNFFGLELSIVSWLWTVFIGLVFLTGILYFIAFIIFHLGNMGTTYQVELFNLINGRWEFTLEETTFGLVSLDFGGANFRHSIIWWILLTLIFNTIMTNTPYGNSVFAVGGNSGAARAQGIDVDRIKIINYMLIGLLVAIAAIFEVARNPGVDPLKGLQWELEMVAMTVIGGALLTGGYGSVIGTLLGAVIFGMLQTGLVLVGMNARLFQGVIGVITIGAVVLNTSVRRIPTK